jgi:hypothetical protein
MAVISKVFLKNWYTALFCSFQLMTSKFWLCHFGTSLPYLHESTLWYHKYWFFLSRSSQDKVIISESSALATNMEIEDQQCPWFCSNRDQSSVRLILGTEELFPDLPMGKLFTLRWGNVITSPIFRDRMKWSSGGSSLNQMSWSLFMFANFTCKCPVLFTVEIWVWIS